MLTARENGSESGTWLEAMLVCCSVSWIGASNIVTLTSHRSNNNAALERPAGGNLLQVIDTRRQTLARNCVCRSSAEVSNLQYSVGETTDYRNSYLSETFAISRLAHRDFAAGGAHLRIPVLIRQPRVTAASQTHRDVILRGRLHYRATQGYLGASESNGGLRRIVWRLSALCEHQPAQAPFAWPQAHAQSLSRRNDGKRCVSA